MYQMILFDVDGVFLSEERCFDSTALTVWEMLYAPHFLGLAPEEFIVNPDDEKIIQIRNEVLQSNQILDWLKTRGVNSNWDMAYMVFSAQLLLILKEVFQNHKEAVQDLLQKEFTLESFARLKQMIQKDPISFSPKFDSFISLFQNQMNIDKHDLLTYWNQLAEKWFGVSVQQFSRNSSLWEIGRSVFQAWYLGDQLFLEIEQKEPHILGKKGFLNQEIPLADPLEIRKVLFQLQDLGITLGIGTGRTEIETVIPLTQLGFYSCFDPQRVVTATQVIEAEEAYPSKAPLGKPEPFTYMKGYVGREIDDEECISFNLPIPEGSQVLIVGDSVADFIAARKMGCHFAATLTGLTGQAARTKFEELGADYILDDVTKIMEIFK
ncbi:HAD family hydrolase [Thermoflavimicrobium daqui]|jgi:phosphoglycolate phosphatase-like HAD superfamily hydrolase|uniref:Phosphatase n=1 Tax=Thermoflavimicrobium daqui TaxID=2137476 RepID=A0A364K5J9_9BACL|nr:HAD hydrolase-like protein [Thermoflavimicrobium daqui]RAL25585.1 phosphatase [Thermoflavimicrobium daqui]